jgi:hypothetical protein
MKTLILKSCIAFILLVMPMISNAQCPMCRLTAEGSEYANSLNSGILYLLLFPVTVFLGGGLFWYYNRKRFIANDWEEGKQ